MDPPGSTTRTGPLRSALRYLVLGAFAVTTTLITLLIGHAVLGATGLTSDPHGYAVFAAILGTAVLTPIAVALWVLYRSLRRRTN